MVPHPVPELAPAVVGSLYGSLRLSGLGPDPNLSFLNVDQCDRGNHLSDYDTTSPKPFDYWHGGIDTETTKKLVAARNTVFVGFKVGANLGHSTVHTLTQNILSMKHDIDDDLADKPFLDKLFIHVYPKVEQRVALSLDIASAQSLLILLCKDLRLELFTMCEYIGGQFNSHLVWTTDSSLEEQIKLNFGERYYFYRHRPLTNGVLVLQTRYIKSKYDKWLDKFDDKLKVLNGLDSLLQRKTLAVNSGVAQSLARND